MRFACGWLMIWALAGACAWAQTPANPLSRDAGDSWNAIKGVILRAAEKMPEEHYGFKPVPEVRSFGEVVAHAADGNYLLCGAEAAEKKPPVLEKTKKGKAEIVAALKESMAYCDARYQGLTDATAPQMVKFFGRDRTRLAVLHLNTEHNQEHYGNIVTYMRLKGIVPPSSEPRK